MKPKEISLWDDIIDDIVDEASNKSRYHCEVCGQNDECIKEVNRWVYNMCDKCWRKFLKKRGIKVGDTIVRDPRLVLVGPDKHVPPPDISEEWNPLG